MSNGLDLYMIIRHGSDDITMWINSLHTIHLIMLHHCACSNIYMLWTYMDVIKLSVRKRLTWWVREIVMTKSIQLFVNDTLLTDTETFSLSTTDGSYWWKKGLTLINADNLMAVFNPLETDNTIVCVFLYFNIFRTSLCMYSTYVVTFLQYFLEILKQTLQNF